MALNTGGRALIYPGDPGLPRELGEPRKPREPGDQQAEEAKKDSLGLTVEDWILALLAFAGGRVDGATRIQKGLFLVKMEVPGAVPADYKPGDYGPFSVEVARALKELEEKGLIRERPGTWGDEARARVFELTPRGEERAREIIKKLKASGKWKDIKGFLRLAVEEPLMRLLVLVYNWYPEYSKVSKIRRKVDYWTRRFLKWKLWGMH